MAVDTDPSTQQHTIIVVCIVSPVVCSLLVAIRIWTRAFVTHSVGLDDCKLFDFSPRGIALMHQRYRDSYFSEYLPTLASNLVYSLKRHGQPFCIACSVLVALGIHLTGSIPARREVLIRR